MYAAYTPDAGEINLMIKIGTANFTWICGNYGQSLSRVIIFLDINGSANVKRLGFGEYSYNIPTNRIIWKKRKYVVLYY
jgi:hypothetical protein